MVVNCGQAFLAWIKQDSRGLLLRAFCKFYFFVIMASSEIKMGIPQIISASWTILKPSGKMDQYRTDSIYTLFWSTHTHATNQFLNFYSSHHVTQVQLCLSFDHHQEAVKAHLHAVALPSCMTKCFFLLYDRPHVWKVFGASLFQKTGEQNQEKSVK